MFNKWAQVPAILSHKDSEGFSATRDTLPSVSPQLTWISSARIGAGSMWTINRDNGIFWKGENSFFDQLGDITL
jgi:hypothetical protein